MTSTTDPDAVESAELPEGADPDITARALAQLRSAIDNGVVSEVEEGLRVLLAEDSEETYVSAIEFFYTYGLESVLATITWIGAGDLQERLGWIKAQAPDDTYRVLRRWASLFGRRIVASHRRSRAESDDWASVNRNIFLDVEEDAHLVELSIRKYSGESFSIRTTPESAIRLSRFFMRTVNALEDTTDELDDELMKTLVEDAETLVGWITARLEAHESTNP